MSMSKRDFKDLATSLGRHNAPGELVEEIANVCQRHNPEFHYGKFLLQVQTADVIRRELNKREHKETTNG